MTSVFIILFIIIFAMVASQGKRLYALEQRVRKEDSEKLVSNPIAREEVSTSLPSESTENTFGKITGREVVEIESNDTDDVVDGFSSWVKEDWLLKLGALLLLIGFAWFVTYAFINNWIGPLGRIALGLMAGILITAFGSFRIKNYRQQGGVFLLLGSTTIILTIFAAREIYMFFSAGEALIIMFLSTAFVAYNGAKYKSKTLVSLSLVLATIAPTMGIGLDGNSVNIFAYLMFIVLGSLWIVVFTGWRMLTLIALGVVYLYSFVVLVTHPSTIDILLLFAYGFVVIFYVFNVIGLLKLKGKEMVFDLVTAAVNGVFLLTWVLLVAPAQWQSLIIVLWMLIFVVGAFAIFNITGKKTTLYVYTGVSIIMLGAATAVELSGLVLMTAYILEVVVISMAAYIALKDIRVSERLSLLMIIPFMYTIRIFELYNRNYTVFDKHFAALLLFAVCLLLLGVVHKIITKINDIEDVWHNLHTSQIITASVFMYAILWSALHIAMNENYAIMFGLLIYTVIGLITYFYGQFKDNKTIQYYGGTLLVLIVVRLLFIDIWSMATEQKIVVFFLIGTLLVGTAFIGKRKQLS